MVEMKEHSYRKTNEEGSSMTYTPYKPDGMEGSKGDVHVATQNWFVAEKCRYAEDRMWYTQIQINRRGNHVPLVVSALTSDQYAISMKSVPCPVHMY